MPTRDSCTLAEGTPPIHFFNAATFVAFDERLAVQGSQQARNIAGVELSRYAAALEYALP